MPSSDSSPALDPALVAPLEPGENALASLDVDLDSADRFAAGRLVLTDRRLLARAPGAAAWQAWPLASALNLQHTDHGGIGQLSLHDEHARLAVWRYTLGADPAALKLLGLFERQRQRLIHGITEADEPAEAEETDFAAESPTPPSTWVLLRLSRFARPYRWQLLLGFALMLVSTAASLVPPYLTIPLMDEVLIPYQNGKQIDIGLVWMLLAGLFGAALVAWALGWWR
ncbi:MAG: ABC transporter, partial [Proteobacteria bacterium]|nr:ABC transporter [Pseudomonadota bacterium]